MADPIRHGVSDAEFKLLRNFNLYYEKSCGTIRVYASEALTGLPHEDLGFLSFHFPASRIAMLNADPKLVLGELVVPKESGNCARKIAEDLRRESERYDSELILHVSEERSVGSPILFTTIIGETEKPFFPKEVKAGDAIAVIGIPGAEFLYSIASEWYDSSRELDFGFDLMKWRKCRWMLACFDALKTLIKMIKINGIFCLGTNGIIGSLYVLSDILRIGLRVKKNLIEFPEELIHICRKMKLDPLAVPSRGAALAILPKNSPLNLAEEVMESHGYAIKIVGSIESERRIIIEDN